MPAKPRFSLPSLKLRGSIILAAAAVFTLAIGASLFYVVTSNRQQDLQQADEVVDQLATTEGEKIKSFLAAYAAAASSTARTAEALMGEPNASPSAYGAVLFSSVAAGHGFASHASIAMAKGAVEALTRSMAAELAPKVRVNCVAPSLTRTPLSAPLLATEQMSALLAQLHPLQRLGEIDDIVSAAAFLLSDKAGWMTGQVIAVDGGRSTLASRK